MPYLPRLGESLIIRRQENRFSCVLCAFATLIDLDPNELAKKVGHDGSEIMFEDLEEPICRRAFNLQEMASTLWDLGYIVGHLDVEPLAIVDEKHIYTLSYPDSEILFQRIMSESVGVMAGRTISTGTTHAVAWNGKQCYDPLGFIYPIDKYEIYTYMPVQIRL